MPTFDEISKTYLNDASNRLVEMIRIANPGVTVVKYIDPHLTPPFWWIYLGRTILSQLSEDISLQTYGIMCRYVVGYATQGIDGEIQQTMFMTMPATISYLFGHKRMVYIDQNGNRPYTQYPLYMDPSKVVIQEASTLGAFKDSTNQVGIEVEILLPFRIRIDQE